MAYVIIGYLVASLAFAAPYIVRYMRIKRQEQLGHDMAGYPPQSPVNH